jgi:hypothetical protein
MSPWGVAAATLAGLGLLQASLVGVRWLTTLLAVLGIAAVVLGIVFTRRNMKTKDRTWLTLGGALSGVVLLVVHYSPGTLNLRWGMDFPVAQNDPNKMERISREHPELEGKPLSAEDWVDASTEAIRQDDVGIRVESVSAGELPEVGPKSYLQVHLRLLNFGQNRLIKVEGFDTDRNKPLLTDDSGRSYPLLEVWPRKGSKAPPVFEKSAPQTGLSPGRRLDRLLIFQLPAAGVGALKLEVPASAWGRKGSCKMRLPADY